jgi:pimeloyl-ACP methyl ester carboxylesterase
LRNDRFSQKPHLYLKNRISFSTVLSLLVATSFAFSLQASAPNVEPYVFEATGGQKVDAEKWTIEVPFIRGKAGSPNIKLAFVRFKSTSPNPGTPIIYLAGGPGGSGVIAAKGPRFPLFMAMREFGDVIALDQRGTGMSDPAPRITLTLDAPLDKPGSPEMYLPSLREQVAKAFARGRELGFEPQGFSTVESALDIDAVRRALKVEKVSLWGISYGTHLGLETIRRLGDRVDKGILMGVEGPDHSLKLPSNTQELLETIDREVEADSELSKKLPSFLEALREIKSKLEREPVSVQVGSQTVVIGVWDWQRALSMQLGTAENIRRLPGIVLEMQKGDFSKVGAFTLGVRKMRTTEAMMGFAMDAASGASAERLDQIAEERGSTIAGDAINFPFPEISTSVGTTDLGDAFRGRVQSSVPVLFISGTLDGRTRPSNAEEVMQGFASSQHLVIERAGHDNELFVSSPQILEVMKEFMGGRKLSTTRIVLPPLKWEY